MAWSQPGNPGAASLLDEGSGFQVALTTIGDVAPVLEGRRLRILLLDVQGYELKALGGLGHSRPDIAIVELAPEFLNRSGTSSTQILDLLTQAGYGLFDVTGHPVSAERSDDLPEGNLVAVRSGVTVAWV